jgi:uncharacterized metal-binding protein
MSEAQACSCSAAPTLIFACSGAADVGEISDRAARQLTRQGKGKMFCLAGVGGRVSGIMASTAAATKILAIDGCPLNCVKGCLEQAGFTQFQHVQLADMGLAKGKSPANEQNVALAVARCAQALAGDEEPCCK